MDSKDFRDNFLTISVAPFQSQTAFIPREWSKYWKTTKCEKKDLSRNLLNLSKTSWDRILALNLTQFDPLTLWESTKILFQSLSARNYADSKTWEILIWTILIKRMIPFPNYRRSFVWKSAENSLFRFVSGVTQLSTELQTELSRLYIPSRYPYFIHLQID